MLSTQKAISEARRTTFLKHGPFPDSPQTFLCLRSYTYMNTQITTGPAANSFPSCPNSEAKHFLNFSIPDVPLALSGKPGCLLLSLHSRLPRLHCSLPSCSPISHISVLPRMQSAIHINHYTRSIFLSKNFVVSSCSFSSFSFSTLLRHGHLLPLFPHHLHSERLKLTDPMVDGKAFESVAASCS